MLIRKKLNLTRYFTLSTILLAGLLCFSSWQWRQVIAMTFCALGISLGLFLLVHGIMGMTEGGAAKKKVWPFILHLPFIAGPLAGSVHLMDDLILLPLFLYMGQMLILFFCLKKGTGFDA